MVDLWYVDSDFRAHDTALAAKIVATRPFLCKIQLEMALSVGRRRSRRRKRTKRTRILAILKLEPLVDDDEDPCQFHVRYRGHDQHALCDRYRFRSVPAWEAVDEVPAR